MLVIQHQPYRTLAHFRRKLVRRLAHGGFTLSGVGASGKPGTVQFLKSEQQWWSSLQNKISSHPGAFRYVYEEAILKKINDALNRFGRDNSITGVSDILSSLHQTGYVFRSSNAGRRAQRIAEYSPLRAAAFAVLESRKKASGTPLPLRNDGMTYSDLCALIEGVSEFDGSDEVSDRTRLDELVVQNRNLLSEIQASKDEFRTWRTTEESTVETDRNYRAAALDDFRSKSSDALLELDAAIAEIKADYEKRLRVEAPKGYWRKKARWHSAFAWASLVAFVAAIGGGLYVLKEVGWPEIEKLRAISGATAFDAIYPLVLITLPALGLAWVLRHISRNLRPKFLSGGGCAPAWNHCRNLLSNYSEPGSQRRRVSACAPSTLPSDR